MFSRVLVSDFGESQLLHAQARERSGHTGTLDAIAPELLGIDVLGCIDITRSHYRRYQFQPYQGYRHVEFGYPILLHRFS